MKIVTKPIPTPHNQAKKSEIAKVVIMPGDPLRSKYIAEKFLTDVKLVNNTRNIGGYTGKYKGKKVTVMATGMGQPSLAIYVTELFKFYDVKTIYRVGSCGVTDATGAEVGDVILATSAFSDIQLKPWFKSPEPDEYMKTGWKMYASKASVEAIQKTAAINNVKVIPQHVASNNFFYSDLNLEEKFDATGASVDEMESAVLYFLAKKYNKHAACLLTVSDNMTHHLEMTAQEREQSFDTMIKLALDSIIKEK